MRWAIVSAALLLLLSPLAGYPHVGEIFEVPCPVGGFPELGLRSPASLAAARGLSVGARYTDLFGGVGYTSLMVCGRGWGLYILDLNAGEIDEGVGYRVYGVALSGGIGSGGLAIGARLKGIFQVEPGIAFGWAMDSELLLDLGRSEVGLMLENVPSSPVGYGHRTEPWPFEVRLRASFGGRGLVLRISGGLSPQGDVTGWSLGGEVRLGDLLLALGFDGTKATFGASVSTGRFRVGWGVAIHPVLPLSPSFELVVRW